MPKGAYRHGGYMKKARQTKTLLSPFHRFWRVRRDGVSQPITQRGRLTHGPEINLRRRSWVNFPVARVRCGDGSERGAENALTFTRFCLVTGLMNTRIAHSLYGISGIHVV
jgi:hypothetical protein